MRLFLGFVGLCVAACSYRVINEAFESDEDREKRLEADLDLTRARLMRRELAARRRVADAVEAQATEP